MPGNLPLGFDDKLNLFLHNSKLVPKRWKNISADVKADVTQQEIKELVGSYILQLTFKTWNTSFIVILLGVPSNLILFVKNRKVGEVLLNRTWQKLFVDDPWNASEGSEFAFVV